MMGYKAGRYNKISTKCTFIVTPWLRRWSTKAKYAHSDEVSLILLDMNESFLSFINNNFDYLHFVQDYNFKSNQPHIVYSTCTIIKSN